MDGGGWWLGSKRRCGNGPPLDEVLDAACYKAPESLQPALSKLLEELDSTNLRTDGDTAADVGKALAILIRDMVGPVPFVRRHTQALEYFGVPCDEKHWLTKKMVSR